MLIPPPETCPNPYFNAFRVETQPFPGSSSPITLSAIDAVYPTLSTQHYLFLGAALFSLGAILLKLYQQQKIIEWQSSQLARKEVLLRAAHRTTDDLEASFSDVLKEWDKMIEYGGTIARRALELNDGLLNARKKINEQNLIIKELQKPDDSSK